MKPAQVYFLAFDFERRTITRYVHHRGCYGVKQLVRVAPEPPETMGAPMGGPAAMQAWEELRTKGTVT